MPSTRSAKSVNVEKAVEKGPNRGETEEKQATSDLGSGAARTRGPQQQQQKIEGDLSVMQAKVDQEGEVDNVPEQQPSLEQAKRDAGLNGAIVVPVPTRILRNRIVGITPSTSTSNGSVTPMQKANCSGKKRPAATAQGVVVMESKPTFRIAKFSRATLQASILPFALVVDVSKSKDGVTPKDVKAATGKDRGTGKPNEQEPLQDQPPTSAPSGSIAVSTRSYTRALRYAPK